jgi:exonuclease SbcC
MLKEVEIRNFQSHKHTLLEFTRGFNVITGHTHDGKSVIVRAIRWALRNDPKGFGFRSHFAKSKELSEVRLTYDDGRWISRERSSEKNTGTYTHSGGNEPLSAMSGTVPDEILETTNMTDANIAVQNEPPFLISETGGKIAKKINKITGLGVIDDMLKKATTLIDAANSNAKHEKVTIKSLDEELAGLVDVEQMSKRIDNLVEESEQLTKLTEKIDTLNTHLTAVEEHNILISKCEEDLKSVPNIAEIKEKINNHVRLKNKIRKLKNLMTELKKADELIKTTKAKINAVDLTSINAKIKLWKEKNKSLDSLENALDLIDAHNETLRTLQAEHDSNELKREKLLRGQKYCPVCKTLLHIGKEQ